MRQALPIPQRVMAVVLSVLFVFCPFAAHAAGESDPAADPVLLPIIMYHEVKPNKSGKGAIQRQLDAAMADYPGVSPGLAVLSDPANAAAICGTHDDFLIASSCLNSTVSGLLSRTFLRSDIIGPTDFHGAAFYRELMDQDLTYQFIDAIQAHFPRSASSAPPPRRSGRTGLEEVRQIAAAFGIRDINLIKPSIGEATRVLLRRVPWKVLVHSLRDEAHLGHIYQLAREKGAELVEYPLENYRACGLIRDLADT